MPLLPSITFNRRACMIAQKVLLLWGAIAVMPHGVFLANAQQNTRQAGRPAPAEAVSGGPATEAEELRKALSPDLTFEQRRELFDLYVRLSRTRFAEALAEKLLAEKPGDKETLAGLASVYLDGGQTKKALETAQTLVKLHPSDPANQYLLGAAYYRASEYEKAHEVFLAVKQSHYPNVPFPFQSDLAASARQAHRWRIALSEYRELRDSTSVTDELRREAAQAMEEISWEHRPQVQLREMAALLKPGMVYRTALEYRQPVGDNHTVRFRLAREDTRLDAGPTIREQWNAQNEAALGLTSALSRRWESSLWAGGTESGPLGGAAVKTTFGEQRDLKLELSGYEQAKDGLLIESLKGRQHRLSLAGNYLFTPHWLAFFEASGREVLVDHDRLGLGHGGNANLEHIWPFKKGELHLGYRAIWQNFSRENQDMALVNDLAAPGATLAERSTLLKDLVVSWLHREGGYVSWSHTLCPAFLYQATVGLDYAFDQSSPEYYALTGFSLRPAPRWELLAEGGYTSSASTSDRDSAQWEFNFSLRHRF